MSKPDRLPIKQPGMTNAEYLRVLRARAVAQGKCYCCRARMARSGARYCDECIERAAESERSFVARRMCIDCCGKLPDDWTCQRCPACSEKSYAAHARRVAERVSAGSCPRCGERPPEDGYEVCLRCAESNRLRVLVYNRRIGRKPREGSCSICTSLGLIGMSHNKRTHERYMAYAAKWTGLSGANHREPEKA